MTWAVTVNAVPLGVLKRLYQELNGHEEATVTIPNTTANRVTVSTDQNTIIAWNTVAIFSGLLTGGDYGDDVIQAIVYDKVYQTLANQPLYTADYTTATAANTILGNILAGTGINVGNCPATTVSVRFVRANKFMSALFIAKTLRMDYYSSGGNTFNIGNHGSCELQLKLDEGSGTTANDTSNMGNDFAFPGGAANPTWVAGKFGNGLSFDGADYISKAAKVIDTTSDFTVVLYADPDGVAGNQYLVHRNLAWYLRLVGGEVGFWVDCATQDCLYVTNNASLLAAGGYYRISASYDQSAKTAKIFVNGVECTYGTSQAGIGGEVNTAGVVYIGRDSAGANYYTGDLDEIQLFQRELLDEEHVALNGLSPIWIPKRGIDRSKRKNHCVVIGSDVDGNEIVGEAYVNATTGIITLGTPGGGFSYRSMRKTSKIAADQTTMNRLAADFLKEEELNTSSIKLEFNIADTAYSDPGDYVVIENVLLELADVYRIQARTVTLGIVTLEIDRAEGKADKDILNLRRWEDLGIYGIIIDQVPLGMQGWVSDIEFTPGIAAANPHNSVEWDDGAAGNATITFDDGTSKVINAGNLGGMNQNSTYYFYYTIDDLTLNNTTNYAALSSTEDILIAKVLTPAAAATTQHVEIIMMQTGTGDSYGTSLFSAGVIITPDFRTAWNTGVGGAIAGVKISGTGIEGFSGGAVREFYLLTANGKGWFGGGACWLDATGLHIKGELANFYTAAGAAVGTIGGPVGATFDILAAAGINVALKNNLLTAYVVVNDDGTVTISAGIGDDINFAPGGDVDVISADVVPSGSIGKVGRIGAVWDEIHSDDFFGTVRYSDMHFTKDDIKCYSCGRRFKQGDRMNLLVKGFTEDSYGQEEMLAVPVHINCMFARLRRGFNGLFS